jgi:bifunctional non-homologous end joining protein LigD
MNTNEVTIEGRRLKLSNLDKIFYPAASFTKADLINYYARISKVLLPHLKDRPLTLKRYPDGVDGPFFYEKQCPSHRPKWVKTKTVYSSVKSRNIDFCLINDLASLVWVANLADLELHTSLSLARAIEQPTVVAFDLDPGLPANIVQCCQVALLLKQMTDGLELKSFPKTSGSKGLQVYVPLNTPVTYSETKAFSHALATILEQRQPKLVTSKMAKELRPGKVFVDWSQNDEHKTTIGVYSLRAKEQPTVSTPVEWSEIERCAKTTDPQCLTFKADEVLARVDKVGDLFRQVLTLKQRIPRQGLQMGGGAANRRN